MSSNTMISLNDIGKCYQTFAQPGDRLKQFVFPKVRNYLGLPERAYAQDFWAIRNVSFEINRGEAIGIVGKNGSGKSTLLQIITGVLSPTEGTLSVAGRIAALLELGSGFNPEFSGRENVFLNGALLGFSRKEINERFDRIAGFADIGEFIDKPVKTYSSGMFVRLAFAVQIQLEPDILIVDEALAVGDALFQKRCYQRIEKFLSNGGTLLFVSHDQEVVRTLTSRAIFLDGGRCKSIGASSEIILEYRRRLHEEEVAYNNIRPVEVAFVADGKVSSVNGSEKLLEDRFSFGDFDAYIQEVSLSINDDFTHSSVSPGDRVRVHFICKIMKKLSKLSFGFRIRNREGVKVYSGGSFADDLNSAYENPAHQGIWHQEFNAGDVIKLNMEFECNLGEGFYEIQAYICEEQMFTPGFQRMLHWKDEAAFFTVVMDRLKKWYGGVCDIGVRYELEVFK